MSAILFTSSRLAKEFTNLMTEPGNIHEDYRAQEEIMSEADMRAIISTNFDEDKERICPDGEEMRCRVNIYLGPSYINTCISP